MSQENVEIVKRAYEVYNAVGRTGPDFVDPEEVAPDLWARLAPDVELYERPELPDTRVYRGREEVKEFWRKTQQLFVEARWVPLEFIDLGHAVLVVVRVTATGRGSDLTVESDEATVFWFRDGRIVRIQGFTTKEQALEAAGISE